MAAVSVSNSNNSREDFEGTPSFTSIGGGAGAGKETVTFLEGSASGSRKVVASTSAGFWVNASAGVNMSAAGDDRVWLCKIFLSDYGDLNSTGLRVRLGADTSNYLEYLLHDDGTRGDIDYPPLASWRIIPIDPNVLAWRDFVTGTPDLTAVDEFAATAAVATGAAKAENLFLDAIDLGDGLYLVGGDGSDADGVFQDFADHDEGTAANRFGHVFTSEGIFFVRGKLIIGRTSGASVTNTAFTDSGRVIVFPESRTDNGWNELENDIGNASTAITVDDCVFSGRGSGAAKAFFHTISDVDGTNEDITVQAFGGTLRTGDAVTYSDEGGSDTIGLTDGNRYWVREIGPNNYSIHSNRDDAYTNTSPVNLSAGSTGEEHSLQREIDTRPDFTQTGTSGSMDYAGCTFENFRNFLLRTNGDLNACKILGAENIDLANGGTLTDCILQGQTTERGEALVSTDDLALLSGCSFAAGVEGHAIEIDTAGSYSFAGNTFSGYGPARQSFDTENDVTGGATDTIAITGHPYADGDAVYYGDEGGTETIGLTDGAKYYVNSIDANTISLHLTRDDAESDSSRVDLTASGAGNGETHYLYSADAAIYNSSGGAVTINVSGGNTPSIRNSPGSTTTIVNSVSTTLTGLVNPTEVRVYAFGTTTELAGQENVTTGSFAFSLSAGTQVTIRIFAVSYEPADIDDFTVPGSASSIPIQQRFDRTYNNP